MTAVAILLAPLLRSGVSEVQLVSGRKPAAVVGTELVPIGETVLSTDELMHVLFTAGGSRYVETLSSKPTHWRTRVEGVGSISVSAALHGDVIEARFTLRQGASIPPAPPTSAPARPSKRPGVVLPGFNMGATVGTPDISTTRPTKPMMERVDLSELERKADIERNAELERKAAIERTVEPVAASQPSGSAKPPKRSDPPMVPEIALAPPLVIELDLPPSAAALADLDVTPLGPSVVSRPRGAETQALSQGRAELRIPLPPTLPNLRAAAAAQESLLQALLETARARRASDLHLVAGRIPLARVAGRLEEHGQPLEAAVVETILVPRAPPVALEILHRDGACRFTLDDAETGRFRVVLARHRGGLMAALRPIPSVVPSLASLGLSAVARAAADLTRRRDGLVIVSSPTGHGRTTTLAAIVDLLSAETSRSIVTVEDPIEHVHARKRALVSQREVSGRDRHADLETFLQEAPDVIVIGDLGDAQTLQLSLRAAASGLLVLATMTAPSAAKAIERAVDLLPPADHRGAQTELAASLRLVVAQRLLPDVDGGRIAAAEVLPSMPALSQLLREGRVAQIPSLDLRAKELGIVRLEDAVHELLATGRIAQAAEGLDERQPSAADHLSGAPTERPPAISVRGSAPPAPLSTHAADSNGSRAEPQSGRSRSSIPPARPGLLDRMFKKGG